MNCEIAIATTELRVRHATREVVLSRRESFIPEIDGQETAAFYWELKSEEHGTFAIYDDDIYPEAQRAAVRYLEKMAEVDELRAVAARAEEAAMAEWRRPDDMLRRTRHFHAEDLPLCG